MVLIQKEIKKVCIRPTQPRLPSAYQEVTYIESDGNAYINTGIQAQNIVKINLEASDFVMGSSYKDSYSIVVFGTTGNSWRMSSTYYTYNGSRFRYHLGNGTKQYYDCTGIQTGSKNTIEYTSGNLTVNGTTGSYIGTDTSRADTSTSTVCFWYCGNNSHSKYKMYSLKITDNNGEHNYVPCYRKSDSVVGLYSMEDETFYTNAGTGSFSKGKDISYEVQIRPTQKGQSGSYDFTSLSLQDLTDAGCVIRSDFGMDSSGIYITATSNNRWCSIGFPIDSLADANSVYLKGTFYLVRGSWAGGGQIGIISSDWSSYGLIGVTNATQDNGYQAQTIRCNASDIVSQQISVYTGDYTIEVSIDFNTGEVIKTVTGPTTYTQTATLNSTQISNIKANCGYIYLYINHGVRANPDHRIKSVEYIIL